MVFHNWENIIHNAAINPCLDFVHVYIGSVSHTSFGWETVMGVLSSITGKDLK